MDAPGPRAVMQALEAAGGPGAGRFVGGCVRDAVLGRPVGDVDIATVLVPDETMKALAAAGIRAEPTGLAHGTITAVVEGHGYEITSLRRDVATDGRRAVVAFTTDWDEDASRRDFRLNALYLEPDGTLHDPTGAGLADARAGRIVFVGDAHARIREDYLRILRFYRFWAGYGRGAPDPEAASACVDLKDGLSSLSAERIAKELLKLLAADDPRAVVRLMAASGVLSILLPEVLELSRFEGLVGVETDLLFSCDPVLRLAALAPDDQAAVQGLSKRLRLSARQRRRLLDSVSDSVRIVSWMSPREIRRAVYRLGAQTFKDRVTLGWAASNRPASAPQWRMLLIYPDTWDPPPFPLSGDEIKAAGVAEGPLVGRVRQEVEEWWIDLDFTDDKMAVLERLKAVSQGLAY